MLFTKINQLLKDNPTLLMTVAPEGNGKLRVTVTPGADKDTAEEFLEPFTVVATPAELDDPEAGLVALLDVEVEARQDLRAAIAEHKAAREEAAKAKRADASKTRQETAKKTGQAPKAQKTLFDASGDAAPAKTEEAPAPVQAAGKDQQPAAAAQ